MIEVTYINDAQQEVTITYEDYSAFERAQLGCLTDLADYYKVIKLFYNGHELDYHDTFGQLYFFFLHLDRSQYEN